MRIPHSHRPRHAVDIRRRQSRSVTDLKIRIPHAQPLRHPGTDQLRQRLARRTRENLAQHIHRQGVIPSSSGFEQQGHRRQPLQRFFHAQPRHVQAIADAGGMIVGAAEIKSIVQPGCVGHQLSYRNDRFPAVGKPRAKAWIDLTTASSQCSFPSTPTPAPRPT